MFPNTRASLASRSEVRRSLYYVLSGMDCCICGKYALEISVDVDRAWTLSSRGTGGAGEDPKGGVLENGTQNAAVLVDCTVNLQYYLARSR